MKRTPIHPARSTLAALSLACAPANNAGAAAGGGVVERSLTSAIFGNTRAIRVYLPPGYDAPQHADTRYPTLYLNDGFAVFSARGWNAPAVLDSLIAAAAIPPIVLVGIDNAASIPGSAHPTADRTNEYLPLSDSLDVDAKAPRGWDYPRLVMDEVMPLVVREFRVDTSVAATGIGGSSYGGIAALTTVLEYPGRFGRLLLESTPLFLFHQQLTDSVDRLPTFPRRVALGIGGAETTNARLNALGDSALERFVTALRRHMPPDRVQILRVAGATHSARAWRERLPRDLVFLFGATSAPSR